MDEWTWPDESAGVELLHPAQIETGQRLAREITRPDGTIGTEFATVWDVSVGGTYETYGGIGYSFRTSDGELHPAPSNSRLWAHPQIRPEDLPPHEGQWITNQRFGAHDHKPGMLGDRYFYERTRALDTFTVPDGRVYRLLYGRSTRHDNRQDPHGRWRCYWVYRWDHGVKWIGPSRENSDLAYEQFKHIREGRAW
ncbi:hypothetical protein ACFYY1_29795 [Streptomyces sp. NPDC001890]|uniref:hypothetical protein n=1 Tax=Streptomyces sp. NPDC001890 TaxID=3364620 RepID=UPI003675A927